MVTVPARARVSADRIPPLGGVAVPAVLGTVAALLFVLLEGHTHVVPGQTPPSDWFGLLGPVSPGRRAVDSLVAWAAILTLGGCWFTLARRATAGGLALRPLVWTGAAWSAVFAVGPPLTSLDIYSYVAHGQLSITGRSPYTSAPADLGPGAVLSAVDPRWHHVLSPYGPIATVDERVAAWLGHGALGTLLILRLVAVLATVGSVALALALTRAELRPRTMALLGLNPLLLTTTFSAGHLEATMLVALLGACYAHRRGWPVLAVVLGVVAGLVKAPALAVVPFLVVEHWRAARRWPVVLRDVGVAVVTAGLAGLLVPRGWGWTSSVLHTPAIGREWWTPSTLVAEIGAGLGHVVGIHAEVDGLLSVTRMVGLLVSGALLAWMLVRPGDPLLRLGLGLTVLAVLGFVLYPWYLLWGWPLLVVAGSRRLAFRLSTAAAAFTMANLWPQRREASALLDAMGRHPVVTAVVLVALVAATAAAWRALPAGQSRSRAVST